MKTSPLLRPASLLRRALLLAPILLLAGVLPGRAALIGYWKFDEGSGTNTADSSGLGLNGTLSVTTGGAGAQIPQWITGRFGNALDFNRLVDANGGRVVVNNNTNLLLNGPFTISFWYRPGANVGSFPGPMRIGSQTATTGTTIGWGYFRSGSARTVTFKRGNVQPALYPSALTLGQWYHIVLRYGGTGATTNNAIIFGLSTNNLTQSWLTATATSVFEFGRMDQHDDCDLDDVAFWNEAVPLDRIYHTDNVPNNLSLDYNLGDVRSLWGIYDSNTVGTIKGVTWNRTNSLPGSTTPGDAYLSGTRFYVVFTNNTALTATAIFLGDLSPGGIGLPGTASYPETPTIGATARLIFDLSSATTVGAGVNDLFEVTGNLVLSNNVVVVNPLSTLANGTYRLINYTGTKTGSLNPTVVHNSRYSFTIDESTPGQINLIVSGANASLGWFSSTNGTWDLTTLNWTNSTALAASLFQQGDAVTLDESGTYGTNISVSLDVWAPSLTINNSTNRLYLLSGTGRIGGLQGGLTKLGGGIATISNPNRFLGPVNINEGTLRVGSPSAFGTVTGATLVASGAILDLNGVSPGAEPVTAQGSGISSTGAVINTGAALVNNGLLGPVTMSGDLTIGGVNRWDIFGGKLFGNNFKLTKTGPPEIALSNLGDTGLGDVEVRQGQLTVLGSTLMGNPAKAVVVTNATFAHYSSGTNIHNKPVTVHASTYNATLGGDTATNLGTVTLATGTNNVGGAGNLVLLGRITGPAALNKNGAGILRLGGTNDYTGFTTVGAGTVLLQNGASIAGTTNITLLSGTVLDVTNLAGATFPVASGQTLGGVGVVRGSVSAGTGAALSPGLSPGTLTITTNLSLTGGATLNVELGAATTEGGGTNDLINVGGALSLSGANTLKVIPVGNLTLGSPYTFLNYTGALSGSEANLNVISDSRLTFTVDTATTPGKVKVSASGGAPLLIEWTGGLAALPTTWDTRNSGNWLGSIFGDQFFAGDTVVFNDFATEFSVTLAGDLYPANTQVEAEVSDYVFSGPGRIRGGGLNKSLAGKLTIANTGINDYPGATVIATAGGTIQVGTGSNFGNLGPGPIVNDGTLILNRSDDITLANAVSGAGSFRKDNTNLLVLGASMSNYNGTISITGGQLRPTATNGLGTPVGSTTIGAGATLQINGINMYAEPVIASGAGIDGNGAIVNNGAGQNNALMFLTLAGDLTVGGSARWDVRANPAASVTGNGYKLTKTNAAQFSLVSVGETGLGDIDVKQGILSIEGNTGMGASGTVTVESNATLYFYGSTTVQPKNFVLKNGARIIKDYGAVTMTGAGSLNGSNALESASNTGTDFTLGGVLSGAGFVNKLGAGNVLLTGENTYSGGTLVSAGNLFVGNGATNGSIQGPVTVNAGGFFYWLSNQFTLPNNVIGPSALYLRTAGGMILDGSKEINMTNGTVEVGRDFYGKLIVRNGANPVFGRFSLGNVSGTVGEVVQEGGNVNLSLEVRVGHWPNNTSTYLMGGGSLSLTNFTNGLVVNASTEYQAILYLGVDGTGVFTQTGGVVTAQGIVLDNRGDTAGTDTFNLEGGTFNLGSYGIQSGNNNANTTYLVNLGGGTIVALTNWSSSRLMTLTGTNGDVTIDTATNLVALSGVLSGPGGLKKAGTGTLRLSASNSLAGVVRVNAGTLDGNTAIGGSLVVGAAGTVSPGVTGTAGGFLTVTGNVTLGGTLLMEIGKTNSTRTNDVLSSSAPLAYGGTLTVAASGSALASGDTFKLFNAPAYGGTFSSVTLPPLDPGLVWDLTQLPINGTIRVTDNLPPVAGFTSLSTVQNRGVTYAITKLVELARDPESDPISFVSLGGSTNGATVSVVGDRISYTPVLNFVGADRVSYVIGDNRGGLNLGQLEVLVYPGNLAGLNILSVITVNGNPQLTFAGIPGRTYAIERAAAVDGPWTQVSTVVCDALGLTTYTDTNPPGGTSFYRTVDLTAP